MWTILYTIKDRRTFYAVECSCGNVGKRRKDHIDSGRTIECKSCASKRTAHNYGMPSSFSGHEGVSKTHFSSIEHGAKRRGYDFDLTIEFLWDLYEKQDRRCALTGREILLKPAIHKNNVDWRVVTASLDRIDPTKGYTTNNVQWVHKEINRLKNNYPQEKFVSMCKEIVDYSGV